MNKHIGRALVILGWCMIMNAYAESPDGLLQKKLSNIRTMHANFSQTVRAKHRVISNSRGTMALAKPNQFRWQTKHPMAETVVADGHKVWIYDVDLEQVTVSKQTRSLGAAGALFLSQDSDAIHRDYTVRFHQERDNDIFDLQAKSSKLSFEKVRIIFVKNNLKTIELNDQLGQRITIYLSDVVVNQSEPASLFQFRVPKGVDVVQQ